jgi:hypothetical protein
LKQALDKLTSYLDLERNWDSYDADPISPLAITLAQALLLMLDRKYAGQHSDRLFFVGPSPDGGVMLEWRREMSGIEQSLEIWVDSDGRFEFLITDEPNISDSWLEGPLEGLLDARTTIYSFLVAENV